MVSKARKTTQEQTEQRQQQQQRPTTIPYGHDQKVPARPAASQSERQASRANKPPEVESSLRSSLQEIEKRITELQDTSDDLEETSKQSKRHAQAYARRTDTPYAIKEKVTGAFHRSELQSEVIKGKMWSEVFGPPRAKRRYQPHGRR